MLHDGGACMTVAAGWRADSQEREHSSEDPILVIILYIKTNHTNNIFAIQDLPPKCFQHLAILF